MSRGGRIPAPPGQLKTAKKTAEPEQPRPKPKIQSREAESPMGNLMAELAARAESRSGAPPMKDPVQQKQTYGVNQHNGFGVELGASPMKDPQQKNFGVNQHNGFGVELRKTPTNVEPNPNFVPKPYVPKTTENKPTFSPRQKIVGPRLGWRLSAPEEILAEDELDVILTCKNAETKESFDYDPRKLEADAWLVNNRGQAVEGRILKSKIGQFTIKFGRLSPGEYEMNIWIDKDIDRRPLYPEDNPITFVVVGEIVESVGRTLNFSCTGAGFNGGEVLKPCNFKIFCKDDNHKAIEIPITNLKVNISQPGKISQATITEVSDGCFTATFTPQQDGEWKIEVLYQNQLVVSNKMNITGRTEGSQCIIHKAPKSVKIGVPSQFVMQARDRMGGIMTSGGEVFKTSVAGPPGGIENFKVHDEANGTYTVSFTLLKPGEFEFFVTLRNKPVDGSPLIILGVH